MIFATSLVLGLIAFVAAGILAFRLKKASPALHDSVGTPTVTEWWPFWIFHFLSPAKWRRLPVGLKPLAFIAVCAEALCVVLIVFLALRFAAAGGNL